MPQGDDIDPAQGDGRRIKLRSWMFGQRLYTTQATIMEFGEQLRAARHDAADARQVGKAAPAAINRPDAARGRINASAEALAPKPGRRVRVTRGDDRHEQAVKRLRTKGITI
ncbi:MAG TPA: hypothetical protein VGB55_14805 [Tepidisphaeraceae bacterium]